MDNHSEGLSEYSNWECFRHLDYCANNIPVHLPMSDHHLFNNYISFSFNLSFLWAPWSGLLFCCCLVTRSCLTLCDPMNCSPPVSSVHGTFQAKILEQDAIIFSRGSSWPRDQTYISWVSCTGKRILHHWGNINILSSEHIFKMSTPSIHHNLNFDHMSKTVVFDCPMMGMCVSASPSGSEMPLPKASSLQIISGPS